MSDNGYVVPVNHGVLSATGSVATGAVGGAAKAFGKTMMWVVGGAALIGFLWGGGFFAAASTLLSGGATTGLWATALNQIGVAGGLGSALLMGIGGVFVGAFTGAFSGIFGAGKGALDAKDRVVEEKGAARQVEMQLAAYQAMAASNDDKYAHTPAPGTAKNLAMPQIDASSADREGTMVGRQLMRA